MGKLQHACKVVCPGKIFLLWMFELLRGVGKRQEFIRLNTAFKSDLWWWHCFLGAGNGMENYPTVNRDIKLYIDASGSFSCGAWWEIEWLQLKWLEEWSIM